MYTPVDVTYTARPPCRTAEVRIMSCLSLWLRNGLWIRGNPGLCVPTQQSSIISFPGPCDSLWGFGRSMKASWAGRLYLKSLFCDTGMKRMHCCTDEFHQHTVVCICLSVIITWWMQLFPQRKGAEFVHWLWWVWRVKCIYELCFWWSLSSDLCPVLEMELISLWRSVPRLIHQLSPSERGLYWSLFSLCRAEFHSFSLP